jgi:hypothetical protein
MLILKYLNKPLTKVGLLLTRAPAAIKDGRFDLQDALPTPLMAPVTLKRAGTPPEGELYELFRGGHDVHKWHHYFEVYERHFERFRSRPIRMLEIGVYRGGSLRLWREYFHAGSLIVGVDIDSKCRKHDRPDENVHVRIGSQADPTFLKEVIEEFGPFDIILDDGSHVTHHQLVSFGVLFRDALKAGGCYLVEDMHTNFWASHVDSPESFLDCAKQMVDLLHEPYLGKDESHFREGDPRAVG